MIRRSLAALLALLLIPLCAFAEEAAVTAAPDTVHTVEKKTYPHIFVYDANDEPTEEEMNLYFVDGGDIPYAALSEYIPFLTRLAGALCDCEIPMEIKYAEATGNYLVDRTDNGSSMVINPETDKLIFIHFNSFLQPPGSSALVNVMNLPDPQSGDMDISALFTTLMEHKTELDTMSDEEKKAFLKPLLQDMLLKEPEKENSLFAATTICSAWYRGNPSPAAICCRRSASSPVS